MKVRRRKISYITFWCLLSSPRRITPHSSHVTGISLDTIFQESSTKTKRRQKSCVSPFVLFSFRSLCSWALVPFVKHRVNFNSSKWQGDIKDNTQYEIRKTRVMESTVLPVIKGTVSSLLSTTVNHLSSLSSSTSHPLSSASSPLSSPPPNSFDTTTSRGLFTFSDTPHLSQLSHTHSVLQSPSYSSLSSAASSVTSSPFGTTLNFNSDPTTLMMMATNASFVGLGLTSTTLSLESHSPYFPTTAYPTTESTTYTFLSEEELEANLGPRRDALSIVIPMTLVYIVILITGLVGNLCTCIVIIRNKYMHTTVNFYLFSLAVSDLILLIFGLPDELYGFWRKYPYPFGNTFCLLRGIISESCTYASVLTITAFTVERYIAICHPLRSHTMASLPRAVKTILIIWIVAVIGSLPVSLQVGIVYQISRLTGQPIADSAVCIITEKKPYIFFISFIVFFVIPMTLIAALYFLIGFKLRRSANMGRSSSMMSGSMCINYANVPNEKQASPRRANTQQLIQLKRDYSSCSIHSNLNNSPSFIKRSDSQSLETSNPVPSHKVTQQNLNNGNTKFSTTRKNNNLQLPVSLSPTRPESATKTTGLSKSEDSPSTGGTPPPPPTSPIDPPESPTAYHPMLSPSRSRTGFPHPLSSSNHASPNHKRLHPPQHQLKRESRSISYAQNGSSGYRQHVASRRAVIKMLGKWISGYLFRNFVNLCTSRIVPSFPEKETWKVFQTLTFLLTAIRLWGTTTCKAFVIFWGSRDD